MHLYSPSITIINRQQQKITNLSYIFYRLHFWPQKWSLLTFPVMVWRQLSRSRERERESNSLMTEKGYFAARWPYIVGSVCFILSGYLLGNALLPSPFSSPFSSPSSIYIYVCVLRVYTQGLQESRSDNLCECVCEERERGRERMEPV